MKKGIQSNAYLDRYEPFESGVIKAKEHGYDCFDYQDFINTDSSYLYELTAGEFENELKMQRNIIEAHGMTVSQTHAPWRYPTRDTDPADRSERFLKMSLAIHGTAILGCEYFVVHNIMPECRSSEEFINANLEFFNDLADFAEHCAVTLCMENMPFPDQPIARSADLLKFVKTLNRQNVKMCLDTGHCTCLGISAADAVRTLGYEYLKVLHIHDNDGISDRHFLPYDGVTDWNSFSLSLLDIGYSGVLSLEATVPLTDDKKLQEAREIDLYNRLCRIDPTV